MGETEYRFFADTEAMSRAAAAALAAAIRAKATGGGWFHLVLAGGSTPKRLYELLGTPPLSTRLPWHRVRLFWGDERFVPHDDPDSNYRLASQTMLGEVPVPVEQVYPIPVGGDDPQVCAERYQQTIVALRDAHGFLFDWVLLGMGEDGHTLSLFPGRPTVDEEQRLVVAEPEPVGRPPLPRITLTLPAVAASRRVLFLAAGPTKAALVRRIAAGTLDCPAARVRCRGMVTWFVAQACRVERCQR